MNNTTSIFCAADVWKKALRFTAFLTRYPVIPVKVNFHDLIHPPPHPPLTVHNVTPFLLSCFQQFSPFVIHSQVCGIHQTPTRLFGWRCGARAYANREGAETELSFGNLSSIPWNFYSSPAEEILASSTRLLEVRRTASRPWPMFDTQERQLLTWPITFRWRLDDQYVSTGLHGFSSYSKNVSKTNGSIGVWSSVSSQCYVSYCQLYRKFAHLLTNQQYSSF